MKSTKIISVVLFFLFMHQFLMSQEKEFKGNPDTAFKNARDLAFNDKRKQAQDTLQLILSKYPDYLDVRAFLASTYSWDGNYAEARKQFKMVLEKDENRKTDWIAYIKNEQYAEKYFKAINLSDDALKIFPNDADLLLLKAKSQMNVNNRIEASRTLEKAVELYPENKEILDYSYSLNDVLSFNTLSLAVSMDYYDINKNNGRANMYYTTLTYSRQTKYGSIIARFNYVNRFETDNYQFELDLYPRIANGFYAYLSGGFSNSPLNPSERYGFELFKMLPGSFELSGGFRWLKFTTETTIWTGSLGWYTGNSYWAFRTYITPGEPSTSMSGRLIYRKYRSDADNYWTFELGYGASPTLDRFAPGFTGDQIFQLDSQALVLGYFLSTKNKKNLWGFNVSAFREEKPFAKGDYFFYTNLGVTYSFRFR